VFKKDHCFASREHNYSSFWLVFPPPPILVHLELDTIGIHCIFTSVVGVRGIFFPLQIHSFCFKQLSYLFLARDDTVLIGTSQHSS